MGKWLSRDPIGEGGGLNLYGYVRNNPLNATDPLGLTAASNAVFFYDFFTGGGRQTRTYGSDRTETQEMRVSPGAAQMRAAAVNSTDLSGSGGYGHVDAYRQTAFNPTSTAWQVGGFAYLWRKNGDGSISYGLLDRRSGQLVWTGWRHADD